MKDLMDELIGAYGKILEGKNDMEVLEALGRHPRKTDFDKIRGMWVPVKVALPDMCRSVIVKGVVGDICVGPDVYIAHRWTPSGGYFEWLTFHDKRVMEVTHWYPLPMEETPISVRTT